jgi:hypothetical protein
LIAVARKLNVIAFVKLLTDVSILDAILDRLTIFVKLLVKDTILVPIFVRLTAFAKLLNELNTF